jgi:hypothetical protein
MDPACPGGGKVKTLPFWCSFFGLARTANVCADVVAGAFLAIRLLVDSVVATPAIRDPAAFAVKAQT